MKRSLLFVVAFLLVSVPHAIAAPPSPIELEITGLQRGSVIEGTQSFKARASSAAGIKKLEIAINGIVVGEVTPSGYKQEAELTYDWITDLEPESAALASNGEYAVTAQAVTNGDGKQDAVVRVIVDNTPATPSGVTATADESGVTLAWEPNAEPDLLGYSIERWDGSDFVTIGQTTDTSVVDAVGEGSYSYRIIAVRSSAARSEGRPSLPTEPVEVSIEEPNQSDAMGGDSLEPADGAARSNGFTIENKNFAPSGLPGGISLPGSAGLPEAPEAAVEWGTFEKKLPYNLPEGGVQLSAELADRGSSWTLMPTDGLRWVAAGALMLAIAMLFKLLAQRLDRLTGPPELKL